MPIIIDELSIWDISFRWAGFDPRKLYLRVPLEVENNFRNMLLAVLQGYLPSNTISLEKKEYEKEFVKFSVYHWLDDIYACIHGHNNNRELLKWATIGRWDFKLWCERMNITLPEFWFPSGWHLEYALPENEWAPGFMFRRKHWTSEQWEAWQSEQDNIEEPKDEETRELNASLRMRPNQEARIACQQIARAIWTIEPDRTIASIVRDDLIQTYGGAKRWTDPQIREWIRAVAPPHVSQKRGAPRKNTGKDVS